MSSDQVHSPAANPDELKVGGNDAAIVLIVFVTVAVAIVVVYLMGYSLILKKG